MCKCLIHTNVSIFRSHCQQITGKAVHSIQKAYVYQIDKQRGIGDAFVQHGMMEARAGVEPA